MRRTIRVNRNLRAVGHMRLLAGKIRRMLFDGLRLHFPAGIDLDQSFRGGPVLFFCLQPHGAAEHGLIILDGHGCAEAAFPLK